MKTIALALLTIALWTAAAEAAPRERGFNATDFYAASNRWSY